MRHGCDIDGAQDRDNTGGVCPESGAPQTSKLVVHELAAADYTLGALDFDTPTLSTPITPLSVQGYVLISPVFDAPTVLRGRIIWGNVGRSSKIPNDLKLKWIAAVEQFVIEKQATTCITIFQTTPAVLNFARGLADAAGITVSDTVLIRQVIRPAFKNIKLKIAKS